MQHSIQPYLRGVADDSPDRRLPVAGRERLPHDTWLAAEVPAGVRLEFVSQARAIKVRYDVAERQASVAGTLPSGLSVWRDGGFEAALHPDAGGSTFIALTSGSSYVVHLPAQAVPSTVRVEVIGGTLCPIAAQPRWLAYGDSITQGHCASDPGLAYPAVLARALGLDVWNLGFAGSARGELPAAEFLAQRPAAVISLAFGTNNWTRIPHGTGHLAGVVRDFITVVRASQPVTPVIVLSPIVRPEAESTYNAAGATLSDLRNAIERVTRELAVNDPELHLVRGGHLVDPTDLVDGIHPGDAGHAALALGALPVFEQALTRRTSVEKELSA